MEVSKKRDESFLRRGLRFLHNLTLKPIGTIDPTDSFRAQVVALLMLINLSVSTGAVISVPSDERWSDIDFFNALVFIIILNLVAYMISRTRWYRGVAFFWIIFHPLSIVGAVMIIPATDVMLIACAWLILGVGVASLVFNQWVAIIMMTVYLGVPPYLAYMLQIPINRIYGLEGFIIAASFMIIFHNWVIRRSEQLAAEVGVREKQQARQRKVAEKAYLDNEEQLRISLDSIGDGVIAADSTGLIQRINPVAQDLTGWTLEDARGRPITNVLKFEKEGVGQKERYPSEPEGFTELIVEGSRQLLPPKVRLNAKQGEVRLVEINAQPIRSREGESVGTVVVFRDVTERDRMEEQLRQSTKMDAIGQLAGGVAHDFNNMLGGIVGATSVMDLQLGKDHKAQKYLKLILSSAERASDLTAKLLTFSRETDSRKAPCNINEIIGDVTAILERSIDRKIGIQMKLNAQSFVVRGDHAELQSAVLNLGINARDALPEGGKIVISTNVVHLDKVYCEASAFNLSPGNHIELTVEDDGVGMGHDVMSRIFELFFTTKEEGKGTGLGLAMVYATVQKHDGAVSVYSEEGVGTVFRLFLPLEEGVQVADEEVDDTFEGSGLVLLVDDEEAIRITADVLLRDLGFDVLVADDGEEGLRLYKKHQDQINIVLLDLVMPKMSGKDLFHEIRKINPKVLVMMSSGFTKEISVSRLEELGLSGFIKKPYTRRELARAMANVMLTGEI